LAQSHGLLVLVGVPWEQHVTFLGDRRRTSSIVARVREGVRACAGHPAILAYAIGNEIPASIVRWHGRRAVERFINRLYRAAKREDPTALVTYVNFPSTEYLSLSFLDLCCFNVFLEHPSEYAEYLARLQNIAGNRPLMLTELGLDSRGNGLEAQAEAIDWQIRGAFASGAAGALVFAWTDEWHRGGQEIRDWDFGLVDRARNPKPALTAARRAFADVPRVADLLRPTFSVIVCAYNAEDTIRECLEGIERLDYSDVETIVVDDGSTDQTAAIAREFGVRVIRTENRGLAAARNTGLEAASGELVAYLDSDACPDPHWLENLAAAFVQTNHAGVGGPNIPPAGEGLIGSCVARAPGGPIHVLISDREAEHIPGCNMAFRRSCLQGVGGFDPQYRIAGDDVDICWRIQERGWTLGFAPGAVVWHRPRRTIRSYLKQQIHYGKAEALLERKWPERYNEGGHLTWTGRVYGNGRGFGRRWKVYYGTWGAAPFQSLRDRPPNPLSWIPALPEWGLVLVVLALLTCVGVSWSPELGLVTLGLLLVATAASIVDAVLHAKQAVGATVRHRGPPIRAWGISTALHLMQPLARLCGRVRQGLTPWRRGGCREFRLPLPNVQTIWSEKWHSADEWLGHLEANVRSRAARVRRGGSYDRWDLEIRGGALGRVFTRMALEEHGGGRQLLRFRVMPGGGPVIFAFILALSALALLAGLDGGWIACGVLGASAAGLFALVAWGAGLAAAVLFDVLARLPSEIDSRAAEVPEPVDGVDESIHASLPRFRRLPALDRARVPPAVAAQLDRFEATGEPRDRVELR
jgi:GT2 family glycosyltransferase